MLLYRGHEFQLVLDTPTYIQRGRAEESPDEDDKSVDGELSEDEQDDDDLSVDPSTSQPPGPGKRD